MTATLTLAHLSDVHLGPLPGVPLRHLNLKRALGFANWHRYRCRVHTAATLALLLADLAAQTVDHIAVTGDLINIGLPGEYRHAADWLRRLARPDSLTVVPGNHDIYTRLVGDAGVGHWRDWMTSIPPATTSASAAPDFPFVRRFPGVALVGLCSAVPTRPFYAGGRLGAAQLARLETTLAALAAERLRRVVLIHHPPLPGQATPSKSLADATALSDVLARVGADLVLHGHNHRVMVEHLATPHGPVPIVGVPSASAGRPHKDETLARYHLLQIPTDDRRAPIELVGRGLAEPGGPVIELDRRRLGEHPAAAKA